MKEGRADYRLSRYDDARILHVGDDRYLVEGTHAAFAAGIAAASGPLGLVEPMPYCTIYLSPNRREYDLLVAHLTPTPTNKGRVGQPQGADLYLLSPSAYATDATPFYLGEDGRYDQAKYRRLIVHECVHMVEEVVRPRGAMETVPTYWSEGLAIYLSGQLDEEDIREAIARDLAGSGVPPFAGLSGAAAYTWGWTLVAYVVERAGWPSVAAFSREPGQASLADFLGLGEAELERCWRAFAAVEAGKRL